jgi:hypothetical protein
MFQLSRSTRLTKSIRLTNKLAVAALFGATFIATPMITRAADVTKPIQIAASTTAKTATSDKPETVEERITSLHAALKITPAEETQWSAVAQAMRDNAAQIEKLVEEKHLKTASKMTAVDDLMTYQEFAQAHVDGLKNLTSAFKSLYDAMPDADKKNADAVFQSYNQQPAHAASR